ncbi:PP0621 family protein [Pararobbsia silviterrae]|uniref:Deaminase n=1 Tax=Pararobbsia silviterrae TaxID=1792498 RepID=A0A494XF89_9BURK|nr:PP0621 family protein [Pararobbsia silviterrae]RKP48542.1 deaminase [Pararobbsia silviterrae]
MSRFILLILIGVLANWWWRNLQRQRMPGSRAPSGDASRADGASRTEGARAQARSPFTSRATQAALPEPMVRCAYCDTHVPQSEAVASAGKYFCSPRHAHDDASRAARASDAR